MLQNLLNTFRERGLKLDPRWFLASLAAVAAILALLVVFYLWRDSETLRPLYGSGETYQASEVMQVLDAEGVRYRVHPVNGQVLVAESDLARARMLMASKGVKVSRPAGYELFDKEEPLGTSQFVQNVRFKRSLEGELAQTIMTLRGVNSARVHLAQEESHSFVVGKRAPAKASVMVQLDPGYSMEPDQVTAIANLVAGSLPNLKPEDVHVVDQYGVLLTRALAAGGTGPTQQWKANEEYQKKVASNIEQVLAPVLGLGNYRVSVAADIDFSQREETQQVYGETPRLRSEVLRDERTLDQLALGVPGSLTNRPIANAPNADGDAENRAATSTRMESNRRHDYDQTITHIKHPAFRLRQQSVAVVINADVAPEGGWPEGVLAQLETMVRTAAGFNAERGDLLALSTLPFAPMTLVEPDLAWWQDDKVLEWGKLGLAGLVSLLILLFGVRPAIRALNPRKDEEAAAAAALAASAQTAIAGDDSHLLAPVAPELPTPALPKIFSELNPLAEIRLPAPGSGLEHQIEHLQMLALNEPERVSEVLKHWIGRNEKKA
ncbi:MAG TPA: flagellar basal-body MS-ring/collar protein FliF [Pseudomonas sp.]|uniref:flagellar basal-body MS-ring/collar protein FliF n=1 Tax=Pseudomonas sp. TaxID=306 RepID=UPI002BD425D7|nr:flagellar basal-body MS-ring/collar protein FliF [Pseudomonas sp.]HTO19657.1 flagellar basal-body MS-ring/collar protein FliF [Pseudomonas sp.]